MKQQQLWHLLLVTCSVWLGIAIGATAQPVSSLEGKSKSVGRILRDSPSTQSLPRLNELERPLTSAQMLVQSPVPATVPKPEIVQVKGVKANPTEKGVEVILQTPLGEELQVVNRSTGNSYIADIPNAQLRLLNSEAFVFRSPKPIPGITEITVTNEDANTIRVTVTGGGGVPTVKLFNSSEKGLIFGVVSAADSTPQGQQPPTQPTLPRAEPGNETQRNEPSAEGEEIEILVTGEQETGYRVTNATTGTRTDTPLRDIPQSIQVVPRQVLEDQQIIRVGDALQNVSGVNNLGSYSGYEELIKIRGFDVNTFQGGYFRDGIRLFTFGFPETANLEQIEVLKGPASILFGQAQPGGIVNLVTKKPLNEPYYFLEGTVGNYDTYRGAIDLSGPLNDSGTLLYRLNGFYENAGSFRDFVEGNVYLLPQL